MDPKYANLFWHEGVKVFEDSMMKTEHGRVRIQHLENDVTKALINLFQHCGPKVLGAFLGLLRVKEAPEAFDFDFQVTDSIKYRDKQTRMMLCIVSAGTKTQSQDSYRRQNSIPDACIFSKTKAIVVESKTQSPLVQQQIDSHIKHYLGTATINRVITWEDIGAAFRSLIKSLNGADRLLVEHFCGYLELIGIADFNGFSELEFKMLGDVGKIPREDYKDFKSRFQKKLSKFIGIVREEVSPAFGFRNFDTYTAKVYPDAPGTHCGLYFYDDDPTIHINRYPNININFDEHRLLLSVNAETRPSVSCMVSKFKHPNRTLENIFRNLSGIDLLVYYKLQYLPMDNFLWNLVPGFPLKVKELDPASIIGMIDSFEDQWPSIKHSLIYQMKSGETRHCSGRCFNDKEIGFATRNNSRPNYAIRFAKQFLPTEIAKYKKSAAHILAKDMITFKPLVEYMLG